MRTPATVTRVYTRYYSDNRQLSAYAEWSDGGRTEGPAVAPERPAHSHMAALFAAAKRQGLAVAHEEW